MGTMKGTTVSYFCIHPLIPPDHRERCATSGSCPLDSGETDGEMDLNARIPLTERHELSLLISAMHPPPSDSKTLNIQHMQPNLGKQYKNAFKGKQRTL